MKPNIVSRFLKLIFNLQEGKSNDVLGNYPAKVHVPAMPERRYLNTSRIMAIASVVSLCVMMILSAFLFVLPPQVRSIPRFVVLNTMDNNVQTIGRFTSSTPAMYLMTEKSVAEYVKLRVGVVPNVEAMNARYEEGSLLYIMSGDLMTLKIKADAKRNIDDIKNHGLQRDVNILWVKKIGNNSWQVRYETIDTYKDRDKPEVNSWFATMKIAYRPYSLSHDDKMKNPFGFRVMEYKEVRGANHPEDAERFTFEE